jgi:acetyl esterase/lipase
MTTVLTVPYGPDADQIGDLHLPRSPGASVAVLVHGGFWRSYWRRDLMTPLAEMLVSEGWAVWNVEYRRVGAGGGADTTLRDIGQALDIVDLLAARHDLDASDVTVVGHSAGGHLAACTALRASADDHRSGRFGHPATVMPTQVVGLAPVLDLVASEERALGGHAAAEFVGRRLHEAPDDFTALSPRHRLPCGVRTLVVHGTADDRVPYDLSAEYLTAARAAGDDVELCTIEDGDHFVVIDPQHPSWVSVVRWMRGGSVAMT